MKNNPTECPTGKTTELTLTPHREVDSRDEKAAERPWELEDRPEKNRADGRGDPGRAGRRRTPLGAHLGD